MTETETETEERRKTEASQNSRSLLSTENLHRTQTEELKELKEQHQLTVGPLMQLAPPSLQMAPPSFQLAPPSLVLSQQLSDVLN